MSRLSRWFARIGGCRMQNRKRARMRAYRSDALTAKIKLVKKEQRRQRR